MMILVSKGLLKFFTGNFAHAIALYPFIILKDKELKQDAITINHELIHLRQQLELLILGFYVLYLFEYLLKRIKYKNHHKAYISISFEREAYQNDDNLNYLKNRKVWAFLKYF